MKKSRYFSGARGLCAVRRRGYAHHGLLPDFGGLAR